MNRGASPYNPSVIKFFVNEMFDSLRRRSTLDGMMKIFEKLGFSENEEKVYVYLLKNGGASIRQVAGDTGINRGTVYEALKMLTDRGLVSHSQKKQRQQFVAEDPAILKTLFKEERTRLISIRKDLSKSLPSLEAFYQTKHEQPVIKIQEGHTGTKIILEDVLKTTVDEPGKEYRVYSAANIREYLYYNFASFSERRIKLGIKAKVIAIGAGGEIRGLDERRWITSKRGAPAYVIIYGKKMAIISLAQGRPHSVVIEDAGLAETQKLVFDSLWGKLEVEDVRRQK
jgi:HTH-type transcriptional regulator, sugar sensing transcriptional regulator